MHTTISQMLYPHRRTFFEKVALSLPPQPAIKIGPAPLTGGEHRAGAGSHTSYAASTTLNILNSKKTTANHANYTRKLWRPSAQHRIRSGSQLYGARCRDFERT